MKDKQNFSKIFLLLSLSVIILGFIFFTMNTKSSDSNRTKIIELEDDIEVTNLDTGEKTITTLPHKFKFGRYSYSFDANFIDDGDENLYMFLRSLYFSYSVDCEGENIYTYSYAHNGISKAGGEYIKVIRIPDKFIGKKISITFTPNSKSPYGIRIPSASLSSSDNIIIDNGKNKISLLTLSLVLIVFAIESFLMLIYVSINKKGKFYYYYLPLFAMTTALYLFVNTPLMYYLLGAKGEFAYILEYVLLMFLPLPCAMFLLNIYREDKSYTLHYKILKLFTLAMIVNMLIQIILTISGIKDLIDMLFISQIFIFAFLIFMLSIPIISKSIRFDAKPFRVMFICMSIIFILVILDYALSSTLRFLPFIGISAIAFISLQIWLSIKYYSIKYNDLYTTKLYKELALKDSLTMLYNRTALGSDIKEISQQINKMIMIMIIDINELKHINDTYGHEKGDEVIKATSQILLSVSEKFMHTKAYRVGGDEFMIIGLDVHRSLGRNIEEYINEEIKKVKASSEDLPLSLAIGYSSKKIKEDFDINIFIEESDQRMYNKKKIQKAEQGQA